MFLATIVAYRGHVNNCLSLIVDSARYSKPQTTAIHSMVTPTQHYKPSDFFSYEFANFQSRFGTFIAQ
jgi:hypothetical protein